MTTILVQPNAPSLAPATCGGAAHDPATCPVCQARLTTWVLLFGPMIRDSAWGAAIEAPTTPRAQTR